MATDAFKNKFRYYLRRAGYYQRELAHELNVDASTLSKWVNGENPWPVDALTRVCELLELNEEQERELFVFTGFETATLPPAPSSELILRQTAPDPDCATPLLSSLLAEHGLDELYRLLIEFEQNPEDPDRQATLREELKKLLAEDETLAAQIQDLLAETEKIKVGKTIIKQVAGDNSSQIGQVFGDVNFNRS